jgi:hypothetical protein
MWIIYNPRTFEIIGRHYSKEKAKVDLNFCTYGTGNFFKLVNVKAEDMASWKMLGILSTTKLHNESS